MAGRPPLPLGTAGTVRVYETAPRRFQARTTVRDYDGRTRSVARVGPNKTAARAALAVALRDRKVGGSELLTPDSRVSEVAAAWWDEWEQGEHSPNTATLYRSRLDKFILPALGELRLRQLSTGVLDRHLQAVGRENGAETARGTKAVLSNVCKFALAHDALDRNPVRDVGRISAGTPRKDTRALTAAEAADLYVKVWNDDKAKLRDVAALISFMLATGLRRGEACALAWDAFDLEAGTVRVGESMLINETGKQPWVRSGSSSKLTPRTLVLPTWCAEMMRERREHIAGDYAFPAARSGGLRDLSNTSRHLADAFEAAGYGWATGHTMRRTVATLMDEAMLPTRAVSDQLGHRQVSMTQDRYLGRGRGATGAAAVLDALAG